jgi:septal ring factor EnvC (AmiA/AmiB activator)
MEPAVAISLAALVFTAVTIATAVLRDSRSVKRDDIERLEAHIEKRDDHIQELERQLRDCQEQGAEYLRQLSRAWSKIDQLERNGRRSNGG